MGKIFGLVFTTDISLFPSLGLDLFQVLTIISLFWEKEKAFTLNSDDSRQVIYLLRFFVEKSSFEK